MTLDNFHHLIEDIYPEYDKSYLSMLFCAFKRAYPRGTDVDVIRFVQGHLPDTGMVRLSSILQQFGEVSPTVILRAEKWLQMQDETSRLTIAGIIISPSGAEKLESFLSVAKPVRPEFDAYCAANEIVSSPAVYENFKSNNRNKLYITRYHPFILSYHEFWTDDLEALYSVFVNWSVCFLCHEPSHEGAYWSISDAANQLALSIPLLLDYCANNNIGTISNGRRLLDAHAITQIDTHRKSLVSVESVLADLLAPLPPSCRRFAKDEIMSVLRSEAPSWIVPHNPFARPNSHELFFRQSETEHVRSILDSMLVALPLLPLHSIVGIGQLSNSDVSVMAQRGLILTETRNNKQYVSISEKLRIEELVREYSPLSQIIVQILPKESLFKLKNNHCRSALLDYCNDHNWWDLDMINTDDYPFKPDLLGRAIAVDDVYLIQSEIALWIKCYGKSLQQQHSEICTHYELDYPETVRRVRNYSANHGIDHAQIDMLSLLFPTLVRELHLYSEDELQKCIIDCFDMHASITCCKVLAAFLSAGHYTQRHYTFHGNGSTIDTTAYPIRDFAIMMAFTINDSIIEERGLVAKAVAKPEYAQLWLWVTLHFLAAWRSTDFIRLDPPMLPFSAEEVLSMAASGELSDNDCINTADGYIARMMAKWHRPNKTSAFASVPPLNFFCPESCKPIFGKILLIAGAHYMLSGMEGLFVNKITAGNYIIPFFGQEFWAACGRRRFSGRRANKALMQAVETQAEETVNPVAAYAIASIMRSHKGGYAKLSQTTDLYLRDNKFQGYTPELIAYLMAERGPCSFVVDYLLGKCYRDSYASLPPVEQTIALKQLGLAPLQIDNVLRMIQLARTQAKIIVAEITPDTKTAKGALIMLCAGHAPGKEMGDLCFRRAAKLSCACPDRDNCTGCLYEIRTKATLLRYLTAYKYLLKLDNLTVNEKNKNTYLRKKIIEPILYEYAIHLQTNGLLENDMISKAILLEGTSNGCT